MIKKLEKKINISEGLKNVVKISSGTMGGQLLSMVTLPILTRIYGPSILGVWTTIMSIATIINSFSDLGISSAIMIGNDDEEVGEIYRVISTISAIVALVAGIFIYVYYQFAENDNGISLPVYIVFLVGYTWTSQQTQTCYSWLNRKGEYNVLMKNPLINNIAIAVLAIGLGVAGMEKHGYFIGCMGGQIITIMHMKRRLPNKTFSIKKEEYIRVISRYSRFVKYQLPTNIIGNFKSQLPTLLIRSLFGVEILGYYSVTSRILQIPITLLANSIGRVFFKTTSEMKRNGEPIGEFVHRNLTKALKIAIVPMIALIGFGEMFIILFFGYEWKMAGELLSIVGCQTLFDFLMMSTFGISITLDKQNYAMISGISQSVGYVFAFLVGRYIFNDVYIAVLMMSLVFIVIQIIYFCNIYEAMKISCIKYLKSVLPIFILVIVCGFGIKYGISFMDFSAFLHIR